MKARCFMLNPEQMDEIIHEWVFKVESDLKHHTF